MSASESSAEPKLGEREWREALVEVEQARVEYAKHVDANDEDDYLMGRRWLRLWRAERRRDELVRVSD
jgi:hypothetical protein